MKRQSQSQSQGQSQGSHAPLQRTERIDTRDPRARPARAEPARRGFFKRRRNRRVSVTRPSLAVWLLSVMQALGRRLLVAGKVAAVLAFLAGAAYGGNRAVRHVIASPRFAVREVRVAATPHVRREDVAALAAVNPGDRLLSVDTDVVAARVAAHPWVASARVRRELPATLVIDVVERRAVAAALLGG
ncbi:MAG TPA: FtsQ-type POTRA domain-containing protein, partial [Polyangia bacterium]|nr:FtsQ-type POTRA domain-containing protein [Polyangia bacterium]